MKQIQNSVHHAFPGGLTVTMRLMLTARSRWRHSLSYVIVPTSITRPMPDFAFRIGYALYTLKYPPITN